MNLAMSEQEREAFLADLHVGVVSIARPDRGPLTVPIWYGYEPGGDVCMITEESSIKGRLLKNVTRQSLRTDRSGTLPIRVCGRGVLG